MTLKQEAITVEQESPQVESQLEKDLEAKIVVRLKSNGTEWRSIAITNFTTSARTLGNLIGEASFGIYQQPHSLIRGSAGLSVDLFGGLKPDIVIHSLASKQNRIIIEVKRDSLFTHKERHASQILRYFLHLLATTDRRPKEKQDINRAVLLAAPSSWFESDSKASLWRQFVKDYGPLAETFHIALGEIRTDDLTATSEV
jgi:hypothetical protein